MRLLPLSSLLLILAASPLLRAQPPQPAYETRAEHDPNGIGKFYMGREIAHVMGHQASGWLERPERESEERTDLLVEAMQIKPGEVLADIGAGSGYFSWRMAKLSGPSGKVFAVDIQQEMLDLLQRNMARREVKNVVSVLGTTSDPKLPPGSVDTMLMVDVYHELEFPFEVIDSLVRALKPGGRIAYVEYRLEDSRVPIKTAHKMSEAQIRKGAAAHALVWERTASTLPWQHVVIFRKR